MPPRQMAADEVPTTEGKALRSTRSQKTKAVLVEAARLVFERDGYFDARIEDIVTKSEVARGTFYTYFKSKGEIFEILQDEISKQLFEGSKLPLDNLLTDPVNCISQFVKRYFEVYESTARMQEIITQVGTVDATVRNRRLRDRRENVEHLAHAIRLWQYNGIADKELDPQMTASALASMLYNLAFWVFIGGDQQDKDRYIDTLTALWTNALAMPKKAAQIMEERRSQGVLGPQVGVTSDRARATSRPLARRGYWK